MVVPSCCIGDAKGLSEVREGDIKPVKIGQQVNPGERFLILD